MSSGVRKVERKSGGSAGMRTVGRGRPSQAGGSSSSRPPTQHPSHVGPGRSTIGRPQSGAADADIPLAAATGLAPAPEVRNSVEYTLVSTKLRRTHNVLRFFSSKPVDLASFTPPVKLRRRNKEYYRLKNKKRNEERAAALEQEQAKNKAAGLAVVEPEKKDERPKADINLIADIGSARSNKKNLFKRRTKQIYFADEEKRRLDIEEARPWVLEDDDETEVWTGSLEGGQNSSYVMFVLADDGFKVVPVDRWYKFTPKLKYKTLTLDEAEEELRKAQKAETHDRWIMHKRLPSLAERADKEAAEAAENASKSSFGRGGTGGSFSKSRSSLVEYEVDEDIFADDDEDGTRKTKRSMDKGKHGDVDEFDYELEFDDDEELGDVRFEFNEAEVSEKKEQQRNASRTNYESDLELDDDLELDPADDAESNAMKKLMRKREGNADYDSEKEENPYASETEEDSDEEDEDANKAAKQDAQNDKGNQQAASGTAAASADQTKSTAASASSRQPSASKSASSPSSTSPSATAPGPAPSATKKRKRVSVAPSGSANAKVSAPANSSSGGSNSDLITKQEIIDLIKSGVNSARDLIGCVRKKLRANPKNKALLQNIVKEVATRKADEGLVLKKPYGE
ncbi:transcription factor IIF subunit tfg1 [Coemansia sp. RSA 1722]|nr:transcription factor IIF subunit tfg1 [Coemansia sp. RSA 1722]